MIENSSRFKESILRQVHPVEFLQWLYKAVSREREAHLMQLVGLLVMLVPSCIFPQKEGGRPCERPFLR